MLKEKFLNPFVSALLGIMAGVFLAFSHSPYHLSFLAILSTLIWVSFTYFSLKNIGKSISKYLIFFFCLLFFSKIIFYQDYYLILANKTSLEPFMRLPALILMNIQVILPGFLIGSLLFVMLKKKLHQLNPFLKLLVLTLYFIVVELVLQGQSPQSPFISLGVSLNLPSLFSYWGNDLISVFYYSFWVLCIYGIDTRKKEIFLFPLVIFSLFVLIPMTKSKAVRSEKIINAILVNEKLSSLYLPEGYPTNFEEVVKRIKDVSQEAFKDHPSDVYYFWNEAAFNQFTATDVIEHITPILAKELPGKHFIGIMHASERYSATSRYVYINTLTKEHMTYEKKSLVSLDEDPAFYPWLPLKYIINPVAIVPAKQMQIFTIDGIKIGIALCNEIMDIKMLTQQNIIRDVDLIINPSNVPQLFHNKFEMMLDEYAQWVHNLSGRPVLRLSISNYVNLVDGERSFTSASELSQKVHALKISIPVQ
ncbi:MAG: hypothetical protein H7177_06865 [Rhizobacter sp.]|nr:hypothetical protein [Bacteriovorax sp.]